MSRWKQNGYQPVLPSMSDVLQCLNERKSVFYQLARLSRSYSYEPKYFSGPLNPLGCSARTHFDLVSVSLHILSPGEPARGWQEGWRDDAKVDGVDEDTFGRGRVGGRQEVQSRRTCRRVAEVAHWWIAQVICLIWVIMVEVEYLKKHSSSFNFWRNFNSKTMQYTRAPAFRSY